MEDLMRRSRQLCLATLVLTCCISLSARADDAAKPGDIDFNRAREIYERIQKGEKVSDEDQAYLEKAKASRQRSDQPSQNPGAPNASGIDWERAKNLYQREQNGEKLSAEDQAYLDKAKGA